MQLHRVLGAFLQDDFVKSRTAQTRAAAEDAPSCAASPLLDVAAHDQVPTTGTGELHRTLAGIHAGVGAPTLQLSWAAEDVSEAITSCEAAMALLQRHNKG